VEKLIRLKSWVPTNDYSVVSALCRNLPEARWDSEVRGRIALCNSRRTAKRVATVVNMRIGMKRRAPVCFDVRLIFEKREM
jgi:hypothetical protein